MLMGPIGRKYYRDFRTMFGLRPFGPYTHPSELGRYDRKRPTGLGDDQRRANPEKDRASGRADFQSAWVRGQLPERLDGSDWPPEGWNLPSFREQRGAGG